MPGTASGRGPYPAPGSLGKAPPGRTEGAQRDGRKVPACSLTVMSADSS